MKKSFTREETLKKLETNVRSACGGFPLAGILGTIYIIRYFIKGDFDFYFSLSIPEIMLKLSHWGEIPKPIAYTVTAVFLAMFLSLVALNIKNTKWLKVSLVFYLIDYIALFAFIFVILPKPVDTAIFIEVIMHFFITLFLAVAVHSDKKLREMGIDLAKKEKEKKEEK